MITDKKTESVVIYLAAIAAIKTMGKTTPIVEKDVEEIGGWEALIQLVKELLSEIEHDIEISKELLLQVLREEYAYASD
jgi:hypothetical protein